MEKFNELKELINSIEEDAVKFYEKDNKAAGVRLRKGYKRLELSQDLRLGVSSKNRIIC
jgi:hypothetical protein